MTESDRRINQVAMYAANSTEKDPVTFEQTVFSKIPNLTHDEFERGYRIGIRRLTDRARAKFGMPPDEHMPEGPLDHTEHDPEN